MFKRHKNSSTFDASIAPDELSKEIEKSVNKKIPEFKSKAQKHIDNAKASTSNKLEAELKDKQNYLVQQTDVTYQQSCSIRQLLGPITNAFSSFNYMNFYFMLGSFSIVAKLIRFANRMLQVQIDLMDLRGRTVERFMQIESLALKIFLSVPFAVYYVALLIAYGLIWTLNQILAVMLMPIRKEYIEEIINMC